MSEALRKFVTGKAKTAKAFDKKFGAGPDGQGLLALVDSLDSAPEEARKAGLAILRENPDDLEAAANRLRDMVYGAQEPAKKTGVQGKNAAPAEAVASGNLPNSAADKDALPDPPKGEKKAEAAASVGRRSAKKEVAKGSRPKDAAPVTPAPEATPDAPVDSGEDITEIGKFVPASSLGGVELAGSFLPGVFDPRVQLDLEAAAPNFSVTTDPASLRRANPMDMSLLGRGAPFAASPDADVPVGTGTPPPVEPKIDPFASPDTPLDLSALDLDWMQPNATPSVSMQALAGLMDAPSSSPDAPIPSPAPEAPAPQSAMDMSLLSGGGTQAGGPMDMSRMADPAFQYSPPAEVPPKTRPPFYDSNRTMGEWWKEPGVVSRANEFLYQRGMPKGLARAIQPTASVIDKGLKVAAPAAIGLGAAYGGLKGLQAISGAGEEGPVAPTEEEMAQTDAALAAAEARVRRMMQPPPKPASAPASTPVQ